MLRHILSICFLLPYLLFAQDFSPTTIVCQEGAFTLTSPLTDGQTYVYQWERSFDGGSSWSSTGSDSPSLLINTPTPGIRYRMLYAADATCLADAACRQATAGTELSVQIPMFSQGLTRCQGDTVIVGNDLIFTAGNHRTIIRTPDGCDSIVETFLQLLPAYDDLFFVDLCPGENFRGQMIMRDTLITETFTASSGCDSIARYEINVAFSGVEQIEGPDRICDGETPDLRISGQFSRYAWSTGDDGRSATTNGAGTYGLTLTDFSGCQLELSHELNVTTLVVDSLLTTSPACPGGNSGTLRLSVSGDTDLMYSRNGGDNFQLDPTFTDLTAGDYDIVVESSDGCQTRATTTITDAPAINLTSGLPEEMTIERGDSLPFLLETDFTVDRWEWNGSRFLSCDDCPAPVAFPIIDTEFRVSAIAPGGCSVADTVLVRVKDSRRMYAPTAFSPNGDDQNDFWRIFPGPRAEVISELTIADRWGGIRFRQAEAELPPAEARWDGTDQGQPMPPGTYIYSAVVRFSDGKQLPIRGQITLMR